jgi:aromatic-L-amino-acid decarboxylase
MKWSSPKYFGYFPSTTTFTSFMAEMFATAFHSPAFLYAMSPSHTEIENIVVDWSAAVLGLPADFRLKNSGGGMIHISASDNIHLTIHAAKHRKMNELGIELGDERMVRFVGYYGEFSFAGN